MAFPHDPQHLPPRIIEKEPKMSEVEIARALAVMMRETGLQTLSTPEGYKLYLAPVAAKPRVATVPSKPVEPPTEKQIAEEEEAMLFAHLG
jgi:hypothetical protein